jgi:hypothetical protein
MESLDIRLWCSFTIQKKCPRSSKLCEKNQYISLIPLRVLPRLNIYIRLGQSLFILCMSGCDLISDGVVHLATELEFAIHICARFQALVFLL